MLFHDVFQHNKAVEHQLSGVNQIVQDTQGFIWFGCEKGLARFDGVDTRVYRRDSSNPFSISGNFVRNLLIDHDGVLWVGTDGGVCYYNASLDRFVCSNQFPNMNWPEGTVHALALASDNTVYIGATSGVYSISKERDQFIPLSLEVPSFGKVLGVSSLAVDSKGLIWIGTFDNSLLSYHPKTKQQRHYAADASRPDLLVHHKISSLAIDQDDQIWIGTYGGGVSVLHQDREHFTNYVHQKNQPSRLASNVIWDIFTDSKGDVWLAVDQGGLVRFNPKLGFQSWKHKPYDPKSLGPNQVRTVFEDRDGDFWIGAFPSGVNFHNTTTRNVTTFKHEPDNPKSLSHNAILDINRDSRGNIWIGTEDGLNLFDPDQGTFTRFFSSAQTGLSAKALLSIAQYDDHTLWIGTWSSGLFEFDINTRTLRPIDTRPPQGERRNSMFIWDILRDKSGNMWIATEFEGVGRYDRAKGEFSYFSQDAQGSHTLPDNYVMDLMQAHDGTIWMATKNGLAFLPPGSELPSIIPPSADTNGLQAKKAFALYEDSRHQIWVGTQDNGTFIYDPKSGRFRAVGAAQGLPLSMSSGFMEDLQGYIWIFTTNGLVNVDPDTFELKVFGVENGLTSNNFNRYAALRFSNGSISVGSADGLNLFNPKDLIEGVPHFPVRVTAMRLMNKEVRPNAQDSPLRKAINLTDEIELTYRDSMFALDFAALDFRHAHDMRYAYILEGFDDDWNFVGSTRSATYTNLLPGKYRFRVKATSGKGDWRESSTINIIIKPAPWQTWWAYFVYGTVLLVIGYFCAHYLRLRGHTQVYKKLSAMDVMTGVLNRAGIIQAAKTLFENRQGKSLCVIFMDLDHFKQINDTRGHDSGDRVLVEVVEVFRQCLRQSDLIGRWGGEEFILVWSGEDRADALHVAEKIRQQVAEHIFDKERSPLNVTLCLGVAFVEPGENFESAINRSDKALYQAKESGRNCVVVAS